MNSSQEQKLVFALSESHIISLLERPFLSSKILLSVRFPAGNRSHLEEQMTRLYLVVYRSKTRVLSHPGACNSQEPIPILGLRWQGEERVSPKPAGAAPERSDSRAAMQRLRPQTQEAGRVLSLSLNCTVSCRCFAATQAIPTSARRHFPGCPHQPLRASCPQDSYFYPK